MTGQDSLTTTPAVGWIKELKFYEKEIASCECSLEEIVARTRSPEALIQAEHFQNQFILQRFNLRRLKHQLKWLAQAPNEALQMIIEEVRCFIRMFKLLLEEFDCFMAPFFHLQALPQYNHLA